MATANEIGAWCVILGLHTAAYNLGCAGPLATAGSPADPEEEAEEAKGALLSVLEDKMHDKFESSASSLALKHLHRLGVVQ
jgi:hypothetical protein